MGGYIRDDIGFRVWGSKFLKGNYKGDHLGQYCKVMKGDTRSLDHSSSGERSRFAGFRGAASGLRVGG